MSVTKEVYWKIIPRGLDSIV